MCIELISHKFSVKYLSSNTQFFTSPYRELARKWDASKSINNEKQRPLDGIWPHKIL